MRYTDDTAEMVCAIKTICDEYDIQAEDLHVIPLFSHPNIKNKIHIKKRLTIKMPLPQELAPKNMLQNPHFRLIRSRNLTDPFSPAAEAKIGIGLAECKIDGSDVQFWIWRGSGDFYLLGGGSVYYFMRRKDFFKFTKAAKKWIRGTQQVCDPPILPQQMLSEIYENSIGFLLKGREHRDKYLKHNIPYKRGILLCGRPGCVTGDTKIKIRKKSNKGTHIIYLEKTWGKKNGNKE